ncbi:hypothetical protein ONZ45_g1555 [Pleurotus djamor]|nr:hypothetical protein ONZ45_g1555 [Pleurotus djamor]
MTPRSISQDGEASPDRCFSSSHRHATNAAPSGRSISEPASHARLLPSEYDPNSFDDVWIGALSESKMPVSHRFIKARDLVRTAYRSRRERNSQRPQSSTVQASPVASSSNIFNDVSSPLRPLKRLIRYGFQTPAEAEHAPTPRKTIKKPDIAFAAAASKKRTREPSDESSFDTTSPGVAKRSATERKPEIKKRKNSIKMPEIAFAAVKEAAINDQGSSSSSSSTTSSSNTQGETQQLQQRPPATEKKEIKKPAIAFTANYEVKMAIFPVTHSSNAIPRGHKLVKDERTETRPNA